MASATVSYHQFTQKLLLTSVFSILLSSALQSIVQRAVNAFAPALPVEMFLLLQIGIASGGLWWITHANGHTKRGNSMHRENNYSKKVV